MASAHGATGPRSIDIRLLLDDDGQVAAQQGTVAALGPAGHDLLSLDVREAVFEGEPAIRFYFVFQAEGDAATAQDIVDTLHIGDQSFGITSNVDTIFAHDFDAAFGPTPTGDGHPRALDLVLRYETLGVEAGDTLTGIRMESHQAGELQETMPGTYMAGDVAVPWIGDPTNLPSDEPASYTLQGPAELFQISVDVDTLDGATDVNVEITNVAADFDQFVSLTGDGISFPAKSVLVDADSTRTVTLRISGGPGTLIAASDLGGYATLDLDAVPVVANPDAVTLLVPANGNASLLLPESGVFSYTVAGQNSTIAVRADVGAGVHTVHVADVQPLSIALGDVVVFENDGSEDVLLAGTLDPNADPGPAPAVDKESPGVPVALLLVALVWVARR